MEEKMALLKNTNLGLSFLLELFALAAFAYWGFQAGGALLVKILLALVAALLSAVLWGAVAAPRAPRRLKGWQLPAFKLLFFALAAAALAAVAQPVLGVVLAALVVINLGLAHGLGQQ